MKEIVLNELKTHQEVIEKSIDLIQDDIVKVCEIVKDAIRGKNKILLCGNGGSAADAQHISSEFTGRYKIEREPLNAISLTTDTSALTAIGNDYGYEFVFDRQVKALANRGDVLIGISTSGNSKNIINAFESAEKIGCKTVALIGKDGGKMKDIADCSIIVPSNDTPRIQEMHILIGHILCESVDSMYKK
jgi:D-sedoheptulose 7-phosphate isomerase